MHSVNHNRNVWSHKICEGNYRFNILLVIQIRRESGSSVKLNHKWASKWQSMNAFTKMFLVGLQSSTGICLSVPSRIFPRLIFTSILYFYLCMYYFCSPLLYGMEVPQSWILASQLPQTVSETWWVLNKYL